MSQRALEECCKLIVKILVCAVIFFLVLIVVFVILSLMTFYKISQDMSPQSSDANFKGLNNTEKMFSFSSEGITCKTLPRNNQSDSSAILDQFFKNDTVTISKTYGGRGFYVQIANDSCSVGKSNYSLSSETFISDLPFEYKFIDYDN